MAAVPVCLSEMFNTIHNDGEQPAPGGLAGYRATDNECDEPTLERHVEAQGSATTDSEQANRRPAGWTVVGESMVVAADDPVPRHFTMTPLHDTTVPLGLAQVQATGDYLDALTDRLVTAIKGVTFEGMNLLPLLQPDGLRRLVDVSG